MQASHAGTQVTGSLQDLSHATPQARFQRLDVPLLMIGRIGFGPLGDVEPPHLLRLLVSTVLTTKEESPICIVLPSADRVTSTVALLAGLECLAFDLPDTRATFLDNLRRGLRVRLLSSGEVFEVSKLDVVTPEAKGLHLHLPAKSGGTRFVQIDRAFWFEPTVRTRPFGTGKTPISPPPLSDIDVITETRFFGNSGLVRTRILLAGIQAEFERTLREIAVRPRNALPNTRACRQLAVSAGGRRPHAVWLGR
jgi:hypothetical protein